MSGTSGLVETMPFASRLRSMLGRRAALALAVLVVVTGVLATRADAFIYWTSTGAGGAGSIGRANTDGSDPNNTFLSTQGDPVGVAVDSVYSYWTNLREGTIGRAFLNGSNANQSWLTVGGNPEGLALDGHHIYWTNAGNAGQSTIGRADINGGNVDDNFITGASFDTGGDVTNGVAVDKTRTHIYWGNGSDGTIGIANLNGNGAASQINQSYVNIGPRFNINSVPLGVAVSPDTIFWADGGLRVVGRASITIPFPDTSFIPTDEGSGVAVDNAFVYWTNSILSAGGPELSSIGRADLDGQHANKQFINLPPNINLLALAVDAGLTTTPPPSIEHLIAEVTDEGLPHGTANSLLAKLDNAQRKVAAGKLAAACGSLGAYINEVQAQSGKKLETEYADALVLEATAVREGIGC